MTTNTATALTDDESRSLPAVEKPAGPVRAWSERMIAKALCHDIWHHKHLMMIPKCHWTGHECDVMAVTEKLRIIDVEIKISRADLRADKDKKKWYHRYNWRLDGPQAKKDPNADVRRRREWPQKVWKHYVAVPETVWKDDLFDMLAPQSGVILLRHNAKAKVVARMYRAAKPNRDAEALTPEQVMNIARLASLRMWDAYETVDQARETAHRSAAADQSVERRHQEEMATVGKRHEAAMAKVVTAGERAVAAAKKAAGAAVKKAAPAAVKKAGANLTKTVKPVTAAVTAAKAAPSVLATPPAAVEVDVAVLAPSAVAATRSELVDARWPTWRGPSSRRIGHR